MSPLGDETEYDVSCHLIIAEEYGKLEKREHDKALAKAKLKSKGGARR